MTRTGVCGAAVIIALLLPGSTLAAAEEPSPWAATEQECQDEVMPRCPDGENCYELWKDVARCTFKRKMPDIPLSRLNACINRVTDERQVHNLVFNEVYACVTGE